jgi:histidinol-phosphate aminotransferase
MIQQYYRDFRVKDYMENEGISNELSNKTIDCALGTNPFIEDSIIRKSIQNSDCEINQYPINGYNRLKEALLELWKYDSNIDINIENISFGSGTMGILRNISEILIQEGTFVLGYSPQFPRFISEVELKKGIYEYYSLEEKNNYKFIVENFLEKINSKYNMIYIDNPNNPTGQIIDVIDIEKIIQKARKYSVTVIIDEAYGDYMKLENSAIKLVNKYDNLVVLRSASKFFGLPNHRIGYLFADKNIIKIYNELTIPFAFSDLSASIFTNILKNYDKLAYTKNKTIEANKKIYQVLDKTNYLYTSIETPIFTIKSNKYENLTSELMKKGIISERCSHFFNLDDRYTRIRINKDYDKLIKILTQVL